MKTIKLIAIAEPHELGCMKCELHTSPYSCEIASEVTEHLGCGNGTYFKILRISEAKRDVKLIEQGVKETISLDYEEYKILHAKAATLDAMLEDQRFVTETQHILNMLDQE